MYLVNSGILEIIKENINQIKIENENLKGKLQKSNNIIQDLSKKLQITLNRVEELQKQKVGFWNRLISKLKTKKLTS